MSSPERAVLEAMANVPNTVSFHANPLRGLGEPAAAALAAIARKCRGVKVKHLFFVYVDKHGHPWRKHVNAAELNCRPRR
ncbi:type IV toxin-antitoxin system AbiEi family antitoxin domain-containing protein [Mesorhizobium atlanticum]|uniref:Uncharacterized protein n=1 Tax=Mesorhizobium atlanticum TaxID=2233532 RepID=A0A330GPP8_9HYPH|nr:hypothetical protein DPM35_26215 [Mesorhizobium atlanticum]